MLPAREALAQLNIAMCRRAGRCGWTSAPPLMYNSSHVFDPTGLIQPFIVRSVRWNGIARCVTCAHPAG
jgi:hypothetical protein